MQDFAGALVTLKLLVSNSKLYKIPSLEAKAYKQLGEYFIGKSKFQSASYYLKQSYALLEKCNLQDELDEVAVLLHYTKAWLYKYDVFFRIRLMAKKETLFLNIVDFVEVLPQFYWQFPLKFIFKEVERGQESEFVTFKNDSTLEKSFQRNYNGSLDLSSLNWSPTRENKICSVPYYYAFSDFNCLLYDEELDQAIALFESVYIDQNSELAIKALRDIPLKQRKFKKGISFLATMEITAALKLSCLSQGLNDLSLEIESTQIQRKIKLVNEQIGVDIIDEYNNESETEFWAYEVEIHPLRTQNFFLKWPENAIESFQQLKYHYDLIPDHYEKLLKKLATLSTVYIQIDESMSAKKKPVGSSEQEDNSFQCVESKLEDTENRSLETSEILKNNFTPGNVSSGAASPAKLCKCKLPLPSLEQNKI